MVAVSRGARVWGEVKVAVATTRSRATREWAGAPLVSARTGRGCAVLAVPVQAMVDRGIAEVLPE